MDAKAVEQIGQSIAHALANLLREATPPPMPRAIVEMELLKRKDYLSPREVEQLYGYKTGTLAAWRTQGRGPAYHKDGGVITYSQKDLQAYVASTKIKTY